MVTFRKQDAWQKTRGARGPIQTSRELDAGLRTLIDAEYIRKLGKGPYEVNPKALAREATS